MSSEETNALEANKALVQRLFDEVINQANHDAAMEILSPDYSIIGPGSRNLWFELGATSNGPEAAIALIERYRDKCQNWRVETEHIAAEGNLVVTYFSIECSGSEVPWVRVSAIVVNFISDGKIALSRAGYEVEEGQGGIWRWPFWR